MHIKFLVESVYPQLSMGLTAIGFWCHLVGFFTPFWFNGPLATHEMSAFVLKGYSGLWKGCEETGTLCFRPRGGSKYMYMI